MSGWLCTNNHRKSEEEDEKNNKRYVFMALIPFSLCKMYERERDCMCVCEKENVQNLMGKGKWTERCNNNNMNICSSSGESKKKNTHSKRKFIYSFRLWKNLLCELRTQRTFLPLSTIA